jgi:hypothetical protein
VGLPECEFTITGSYAYRFVHYFIFFKPMRNGVLS